MAEPRVLLWDIGGVLLSNGFDDRARAIAATTFGFDLGDFERRHAAVVDSLERGGMSVDEYLDATLFYTPRAFERAAVRAYIVAQSTPHPDVIALAESFATIPELQMVAFNNEGTELNEERIRRFGLDRFLRLFFSSCYTGRRKPEVGAYELVLGVLRRAPGEIVYVDDRLENLAPAKVLGIHTIHFTDTASLRRDLASAGISA